MRQLRALSIGQFTAQKGVGWFDRNNASTIDVEFSSMQLPPDTHFKPERLLVTRGEDWKIWSLVIDGREQIDQCLPGYLFSTTGQGRAPWLDVIRPSGRLRMTVAYNGHEEVGRFSAVLLGVDVQATADPRAYSGPIRFRESATGTPIAVICDGPERVLPGQSAWFTAQADTMFRVDDLVLDLGCDEWQIKNISVGDRSQVAPGSGPIPGDLFSPGLTATFLRLDPGTTITTIRFEVAYVGEEPSGRAFGVTCSCVLVR